MLGMDSTRMRSADQNSAAMASLLDRIPEPQIAARVPFELQRDQAAKTPKGARSAKVFPGSRGLTTHTSPRNYPGSCSQREPKRPKASYIAQRSLVQIQPPQP